MDKKGKNKFGDVDIIPGVPMFYRKYSGKRAWARVVLQRGHFYFTYSCGRVKGGAYYGSQGCYTKNCLNIDRGLVLHDPDLKKNKCFRRWRLRVLREIETEVDLETGMKTLSLPCHRVSPEGVREERTIELEIHQELSKSGRYWTEWDESWIGKDGRRFVISSTSHNLSRTSVVGTFFPWGYKKREHDITYLGDDRERLKYAETIVKEGLLRPTYLVKKMLEKHGVRCG